MIINTEILLTLQVIKDVLEETYDGHNLLSISKKRILNDLEKNTLTRIIINRCEHLERGFTDFFEKIDEAIRQLMPQEPKVLCNSI